MAQATHWALTHELHQRIDSITQCAARGASAELLTELDGLRKIALAHGMTPAISIVHALESTLASGQRGPLIADGLSLLRDAISCGRTDARSASAYAAAFASRLAS